MLSRARRLLNTLSFHDPWDIVLGPDYSTRECELTIQGFVLSRVAVFALSSGPVPSVDGTHCRVNVFLMVQPALRPFTSAILLTAAIKKSVKTFIFAG